MFFCSDALLDIHLAWLECVVGLYSNYLTLSANSIYICMLISISMIMSICIFHFFSFFIIYAHLHNAVSLVSHWVTTMHKYGSAL